VLNYQIHGNGKSIVFLHGFLESSSMWSNLDLQELNTQNIFIDLPGHGASELNDFSETPSIDFMAAEVLKVLNLLTLESYSIIGHSMGGYVGLLLKEMDSRCKKIVLVNSNFWADTEQKKKDRIRVAEIAFKAKNIFLQEAIPHLFAMPEKYLSKVEELKNEASKILPESIAYSALAMRERKDYTKELKTNPSDYFIIHGMLDRLVDTDFLREQLISDNNLFILENAGHMAHIEQSEEVLGILKEIFS
jgi:pimeloyl-ACP methyl ester carboxylesterase